MIGSLLRRLLLLLLLQTRGRHVARPELVGRGVARAAATLMLNGRVGGSTGDGAACGGVGVQTALEDDDMRDVEDAGECAAGTEARLFVGAGAVEDEGAIGRQAARLLHH